MSIDLYFINREIMALVNPETGEIEDFERLEQLNMERLEKLENIACWVKNLTAEADALKQEEQTLAKRRQAAQAKADRLKRYLCNALNGEKLETPRVQVKWRKTTAVHITDATTVAEWAVSNGYPDLVVYDGPKISKADLKTLLNTQDIPGAELTHSVSMSVS